MIQWLWIFLNFSSALVCLEDPSVKLHFLRLAWKLDTGGGRDKSYNELVVNGVRFPGERKWDLRWNLIKDVISFKGKKILELGSNVALASVYLLKYRKAASCTAVDLPNAQLAQRGTPHLLRAARLVQRAFGMRVKLLQVDLNKNNYESSIGYSYDVVICMSLLKWVHDKERLLQFLSHFPHVIYEGHDSDDREIARFRAHGFTSHKILGKTHIGVSYASDKKRTLIYFSR